VHQVRDWYSGVAIKMGRREGADGGRIKSAGKMCHADFLNWVDKKLEEGWEIYSCYEAGASGYWLHRKQKTDKRDSGELCDSLDRYLRGQDKALSMVGVPTEEQEEKRALIRYHRQIMAPAVAVRLEVRAVMRSRHRSAGPLVAGRGVDRNPARSWAQGLDKGTADCLAQ
jgi:hypothetical protein